MGVIHHQLLSGFSVFKVPPPLDSVSWADANYRLPAGASYTTGRWSTYDYQKGILRAMTMIGVEQVAFKKSARLGYSQLIAIAIAYNAAHKSRNQIAYRPTAESARQWMGEVVDPCVRDCPPLRKIASWYGKRTSANTNALKRFDNGKSLYVLSGTAAKSYRDKSPDVVYLDELSSYPADVENEGSPLSLATKRVEGSLFKKVVLGTTPTIEPCVVSSEYDASDVTLVRKLRCHACGDYHALEWERFDATTATTCCASCGAVWEYRDLASMDAGGRWECLKTGNYIDDSCDILTFKSQDGSVVPNPRTIGFYLWTAYSRMINWRALCDDWTKKHGNSLQERAFLNTTLGIPWKPHTDAIQLDELDNAMKPIQHDLLHADYLIIVAGIDVQKDRIEASFVSFNRHGDARVLSHEIFDGDTTEPHVWQDLEKRLDMRYQLDDGRLVRLDRAFVDSGYNAATVYNFCRKHRNAKAYAIKGRSGFDLEPAVTKQLKDRNKNQVPFVQIGADVSKLLAYDLMRNDGRLTINKDAVPSDYLAQLTAEEIITDVDKQGRESRRWVKKQARNEALDCLGYACAAFYHIKPIWSQVLAARGAKKPLNGA